MKTANAIRNAPAPGNIIASLNRIAVAAINATSETAAAITAQRFVARSPSP